METQKNPGKDAASSGQAGDESLLEVKSWANQAKYQPEFSVKSRKRGANVFSDIGKLQNRPPPRPASPIPVEGERDWKGVTVKLGLKGDGDKKVCLVEIHGKPLVLKGAIGTPEAHVAATNLIGKLGLKGMRTPASRLLTDREKASVIQEMASSGDSDAKDLAKALTKGTGQVSEPVSGIAFNKVFLDKKETDAQKLAIEAREKILDSDVDAAWKATFTKLKSLSEGTLLFKHKDVDKWIDTTDDAVRKEAMEYVHETCGRPSQLALLKVLGEITGDTVKVNLAAAKQEDQDRDKAKATLQTWAQSAQGVEAFAGVVACDIVTGQHDRVATWNGGNFMFDPAKGELCCVDNLKEPKWGLTAPDNREWEADFFTKKFCGSGLLEDQVFELIYGKNAHPNDPDSPGNYTDFDEKAKAEAKETIRKVLAEVVAKVEADPTAFPGPERERAAFLKCKLVLDEILRVPADLAKPLELKDLGALGKTGRAAKSFFTPNSKDKRNDTQQIKDDLRSGAITPAEARAKLLNVTKGKKDVADDRRSDKITLMVSAMEFCEFLNGIGKALDDFTRQAPPSDAWSAASVKAVAAPLRAAIAHWQKSPSVLRLKGMEDKLKTAVAGLPDVVKLA